MSGTDSLPAAYDSDISNPHYASEAEDYRIGKLQDQEAALKKFPEILEKTAQTLFNALYVDCDLGEFENKRWNLYLEDFIAGIENDIVGGKRAVQLQAQIDGDEE